jgi:N-acetylglutamate synthase-like GNAT family acetyltransferase
MSDDPVRLRRATIRDLPAIHGLIRASFAAMNDHAPHLHEVWAKGAEQGIADGDVSAASFEKEYLSSPDTVGFWVAEHRELGVIGCAGLKRTGPDEGELLRMAVSPSVRGGGVGARLVSELMEFARRSGVRHVHLTTANPTAARFYRKTGFALESEFPVAIKDPVEVTLTVVKMGLSLEPAPQIAQKPS